MLMCYYRLLPATITLLAAAQANAAAYTFTTLDVLGATYGTYAEGINSAGQITGYYVGGDMIIRGFVDDNGVVTIVGVPDGFNGNYPRGINAAGTISGYYTIADGTHGFIQTNGLPATLVTV